MANKNIVTLIEQTNSVVVNLEPLSDDQLIRLREQINALLRIRPHKPTAGDKPDRPGR